jgi:hypothetical protein
MQRMPLFKSATSQHPCVSYQRPAVNIRFLLTTFKGNAKIGFLYLTGKSHT